jgi:hypothetical protein
MVIIGGGYSILSFPNIWHDINDLDVMTINYAYQFMTKRPKWQFSIDRKFWSRNAREMDKLQAEGTLLVGRNNEFAVSKTIPLNGEVYCGQRKLSGVAAISWAVKNINPIRIILFGFDFGLIDKTHTHFYAAPAHSGIGKTSAYHDNSGPVLDAVHDFDNFKGASIFIVGETNIKSFPKITYAEALALEKVS